MTTDNTSPRPWCAVETSSWTLGIASLHAKKIVASVPAGSDTGKEDRALIVRAVNAHDALVEAVDEVHALLYHYDLARQPNGVDWGPVEMLRQKAIDQLWAALKLARAE